jgi:hypothetical protein
MKIIKKSKIISLIILFATFLNITPIYSIDNQTTQNTHNLKNNNTLQAQNDNDNKESQQSKSREQIKNNKNTQNQKEKSIMLHGQDYLY